MLCFVGEMENRIGGKTKYLGKENLKGEGIFSFMFFDRREKLGKKMSNINYFTIISFSK